MKALVAIEEAYRPKLMQALKDKDYTLHEDLRKCMAAEAAPYYRIISREANTWQELKAKLEPMILDWLHRYFLDLRNHALGIYLMPPDHRMPPTVLHLNELSLRVSGGLRMEMKR